MLYEKFGMEYESDDTDPFFLTTWDASHWFDLVMQKLREDDASSAFLKRLIKRSRQRSCCISEVEGLRLSHSQQRVFSARRTNSGKKST